jgi:hypothetical protein
MRAAQRKSISLLVVLLSVCIFGIIQFWAWNDETTISRIMPVEFVLEEQNHSQLKSQLESAQARLEQIQCLVKLGIASHDQLDQAAGSVRELKQRLGFRDSQKSNDRFMLEFFGSSMMNFQLLLAVLALWLALKP